MSKEKIDLRSRLKERIRKTLVSLKRRPNMIPMVFLGFSFLWYALQLTKVSNATASINGANMGLCEFAVMLLSILGLVCFGYSFPHRKPVNRKMLILMFVLFGIVIFADITYLSTVRTWVYREFAYGTAASFGADLGLFDTRQLSRIQTKHIVGNLFTTHIILVSAGLLLTALLPVYSPLIRKIRTSVHVDENENMTRIDLAGEDA